MKIWSNMNILDILIIMSIITNKNTKISGWRNVFLRLCLKVFKLLIFFSVSGIWFQSLRPKNYKVFWSVPVLKKNVSVNVRSKFENLIQVVRTIAIEKFKQDSINTFFKCFYLNL